MGRQALARLIVAAAIQITGPSLLDILSITGVIFALIAAGFATVRGGLFSSGDMTVLGRFVVNLALPALIFRAISTRSLGEIANTGYLLAYLIGSLAVFALGYAWSRRAAGAGPMPATFNAMGMSCSNSGFIGYPLLLLALPSVAQTALALNMVIENLVMIPLILILAEKAGSREASGAQLVRRIGGRLVQSPIVLALVAGLTVSLLGLGMPPVLDRSVAMLASASAPLSLVVIGGTLAGLDVAGIDRGVFAVVAGKLLVHPVAVAVALLGLSMLGLGPGDDRLVAAAILMASTPAMSIYPIIAQSYGEPRVAALAMFVMTALSFLTMSVGLAILLPML